MGCRGLIIIYYFNYNEKFTKQIADLTESWKFIEDFCAAFSPLYGTTKYMQEHHVGLSDFYLAWLDTTRKVSAVDNELATDLKAALESRLEKLKTNMPLKAALLLDPRFNFMGSTLFTPEEKNPIKVISYRIVIL